MQTKRRVARLTRIQVRGADRNHRRRNRDVFENFVAVRHGVENGSIVVEIQNVAVNRDRAGQRRMAGVLRLHHQDVVLHLKPIGR